MTWYHPQGIYIYINGFAVVRSFLRIINPFDKIYDTLTRKKLKKKSFQAVLKNVLYKMYLNILYGPECPWIPYIYYPSLDSK